MSYFKWDTKTINDFAEANITSMYNNGYVFTRIDKGIMNQTRSLRIRLSDFTLNSENRRVLRKTEKLKLSVATLPLTLDTYDWRIQKLGKDYYKIKFGSNVFSANKIKELITNDEKSNFNTLLCFSEQATIGYAICYMNNEIMHYAYPFYNIMQYPNNYGMGMMLRAILFAKDEGCQFIYLGSISKQADKYKLQFEGLEWFDGNAWQSDLNPLDEIIQ